MDLGVFSIVPIDFAIFFVMWIVLAIVALQGGRGEVLSMLLGAFIGVVVYENAQKAFWLSGMIAPYLADQRTAAIVLGVLIVLGYLITRLLMLPYGSDLVGSPTQSAIVGFLTTAVLLSIWIATPFTNSLWHFGSLFEMIFSSAYTFWWIIASLGLLALFG